MVRTNRSFFDDFANRAKFKNKLLDDITSEENSSDIRLYLKRRSKESDLIRIEVFDKCFRNIVSNIMDDLKAYFEISKKVEPPDKLRKRMISLGKKLRDLELDLHEESKLSSFFDILERGNVDPDDNSHMSEESIRPATTEEITAFFDSPFEEKNTTRSRLLHDSCRLASIIEHIVSLPDEDWIWFQRLGDYPDNQKILFRKTYKTNNKALAVAANRLIPLCEEIGITSQKGQGAFISLFCKAMNEHVGKYFRSLGTLDFSPETARVYIKNTSLEPKG